MANPRPGTIRPSIWSLKQVHGLLPALAEAAGMELSVLRTRRGLYQAARRFLELQRDLASSPLHILAAAGKERPSIFYPGYRASEPQLRAYRQELRQFWMNTIHLECRPGVNELNSLATGIFEGRRIPVEVTPLNRMPWTALLHAASIVSPAPEDMEPNEDFLASLKIECLNNPHGIVPRSADGVFKAAILQRYKIRDEVSHMTHEFDITTYLGHDDRAWLVAAPAKMGMWDSITRRSDISAAAETRAMEMFIPAPEPDGLTVGVSNDGQKIRADILSSFSAVREYGLSIQTYKAGVAMRMSAFDAIYFNAAERLAGAWKALHPWDRLTNPQVRSLQLTELTISPDTTVNKRVQTAVIANPYLFQDTRQVSEANSNVHVLAMETFQLRNEGFAPERIIQSSAAMERLRLRFEDSYRAEMFIFAHATMKSINPHFRLVSAAEGARLATIPTSIQHVIGETDRHLIELAGRALRGPNGIGKFMGEDDVVLWMAERFNTLQSDVGLSFKASNNPDIRPHGRRLKLACLLFLKKAGPGGLPALRRLGRLWHERIDRMKEEERALLGETLGGEGPKLPDFSQAVSEGWSAVQLRDAAALSREGRRMNHCVVSYESRVRAGDSFIIALSGPNGSRSTAELRLDRWVADGREKLPIVQHHGPGNMPAPPSHREMLVTIRNALLEDRSAVTALEVDCEVAHANEEARLLRRSAELTPKQRLQRASLAWLQLGSFIPREFAKMPVKEGIRATFDAFQNEAAEFHRKFAAANGTQETRPATPEGASKNAVSCTLSDWSSGLAATSVRPDPTASEKILDDDLIPF